MNHAVFCRPYEELVITRSVLEVIAAVHKVSVEKAAEIIYHNTLELYFPWELCLRSLYSNVDKLTHRNVVFMKSVNNLLI